jgi:LuxR family maltose regulon positive regulatory protein
MPGEAPVPTVATKLVAPRTPQYLIIRKRLLDMLDAGLQAGSLVLLSAPAGAGKTILLASWVQARKPPGPVAWLSLDADDDDASRLAADLLSALRRAGIVRRGSALDRLAPPSGARADGFLASFVNGLARVHTPFVLILDDVQELTSPQASAMIDFLVRHAPEQCRLVLAGRTDPPLPIERLRVSGEQTELRVADLAFDRGEAGALFRQLDLGLSDAEIDTLWQRTEGWAAALRLAGLSLQEHPDPRQFVAEFAGTDRAVADYLVSEVLVRMPADRREFMLRTSLVDTLNSELADALTGLEGGAHTLAALERSGAPLQQDHADASCCRYHPLFGELLRAHLHHSHPEEVPLLHRRAARWYARCGQTKRAIGHALAGRDWDHAGELIGDNWLELFINGSSATVRGPMAQLPADVIAARPSLAVAFAGSRLEDGDLDHAEHYLSLAQHAEQRGEDQQQRLETALAAVGLLHARRRLNVQGAELHAHELMKLARNPAYEGWTRLRSFALSNLGATMLWAGDPSAGAVHTREALALASEDASEHIMLDCLAQLAFVDALDGEIKRAGESAQEAVRLAEHHGWEEGPGPACAYLAMGSVAYWRGDFEQAEGLAGRAASAADTAELPVRLAVGVLQALTLAAAGPHSAARGMLKLRAVRARIADSDATPEFLRVALEDTEPRVMSIAGEDGAAAAALASACRRMPESPVLRVRQASLELHAGDPEHARSSLASAIEADEAGWEASHLHPAERLEACVLQALAEHASGEQQAASASLERALALAEQDRLCGPFLLEERHAIGELLETQAQVGTAHPALLEVLLESVDGRTPYQPDAGLLESLTERELRILRYLPTMLSNAEIGAEMFVSLNTVKTHLRSIYRKLDVGSRSDAVHRARSLSLLPHGIRRPRVVYRGP